MKYSPKEIKKLGRAYGKRAFKLTENDYTDLAQIEQAYLAGYKKGYNEVNNIEKACEYFHNYINKDLMVFDDNKWVSINEFIKRFKKTKKNKL